MNQQHLSGNNNDSMCGISVGVFSLQHSIVSVWGG